jgi:hypothetical protein
MSKGIQARPRASGGYGQFTSHIFFSLINHECIASMLFLLFVWFFILMCINHNAYLYSVSVSIDRSEE